jgi:hypothetical protein
MSKLVEEWKTVKRGKEKMGDFLPRISRMGTDGEKPNRKAGKLFTVGAAELAAARRPAGGITLGIVSAGNVRIRGLQNQSALNGHGRQMVTPTVQTWPLSVPSLISLASHTSA